MVKVHSQCGLHDDIAIISMVVVLLKDDGFVAALRTDEAGRRTMRRFRRP